VPSVASARGVSAKKVRIRSGVPPNVVPRLLASNTQTSARPTPCVVICGSPAPVTAEIEASVRCWPRCAVVMNARVPPVPANTMSRGSSPTISVRTTRGGICERSTTLTLSERWLTTHTSELVRAATATGSMPTGIENVWLSPPPFNTSNTSRRLSGMLVTSRYAPFGVSATGRTAPLSNSMKVGIGGAASAGNAARANKPTSRVARFMRDSFDRRINAAQGGPESGPDRATGRQRWLYPKTDMERE
jgi:hypothetical protein